MRILIIIFFCLSFTTTANAQQTVQQRIDSMLALLPVVKDDTNRTKLIYRISDAYNNIDPKESMRYIEMGMADARKKKFDKGIASFHASIASIQMDNGQIDAALLHLDTSLMINKKIDNKRGIASTLINIGVAYQRSDNDIEAIRYTLQAIPYLEIVKDTPYLALTYNNLANSYMTQKNYKDAELNIKKSLTLSTITGNTARMAKSNYQLGIIAFELADTLKAMKFFNESLQLSTDAEDQFGIAESLQGMGAAEKYFPKAMEYKTRSQALWDELAPDHPTSVMNLTNMGIAYLDLVRFDQLKDLKPGGVVPKSKQEALQLAKGYLTKAVAINKSLEKPEGLWFSMAHLSMVQELQGDYKSALENHKRSTEIHDSLYSQENKNQIAALTGERELALRDKELQLNKISLSAQKKQRIGLIAGLLLVTAIGGLLYWQNRTRKKTNSTLLILNNELDEANKVKARFFGIISHDLRSPIANLIAFLNLQKDAPDVFTAEQASTHQASITTAAESILETMESMLQWSKSQMEHFKPQYKQVSVEHLFKHIQNNFGQTGGLKLQFSNPNNLLVNTDEDYLKTIMHNLTANATKALQQNSNGVIEWKAVEENGKTVLSITDNGPGAAANQLDALYNKDAAVNSKNGLGLHLIRDLAKAIECAISFSSAPNAGTTFQLRLG